MSRVHIFFVTVLLAVTTNRSEMLLVAEAQFPGRVGDVFRRGKQAADAFIPITTDQEVAMGREVAAKMIGYFKVWENEKAASYVRKVGQALALQSDRQDVKYYFEVLDTDDVNAFATPGGYIFVTRGLLETLNTEAELAGVLGHEVGHVAGKHIVEKIQRDKLVQTGINEAGAWSPGSAYLTRVAGKIIEDLMGAPMDQKDENDADRRGVNYAYAAGYHPAGLKGALEALLKLSGPSGEEKKAWLKRTHPPLEDRIRHVERIMAENKMQADGRADLAERYQAAIKFK